MRLSGSYNFLKIGTFVLISTLISYTTSADSLKLNAPENSSDGTFILRLTSQGNVTKEVEIYRNKNGGKFAKIAEAPLFSSISQIIFESGTYGYQVRTKPNSQDDATISDTVFVKVNSTIPPLPKKKLNSRITASF